MKIATCLPTYAGCEDLPRCLRYLGAAENYACAVEPDWEFVRCIYEGTKVGDGHAWSAERDRAIAESREGCLRAGFDTGADWIAMNDTDVMVPPRYYTVMGNLHYLGPSNAAPVGTTGGPATGYGTYGLAKTCPVFNKETGSFRFVNERMEGVFAVDNAHRRTAYTSEVLWLHRSVVERIPKPFWSPSNLNEDYELCRILKGLGVDIYVAPVECVAT